MIAQLAEAEALAVGRRGADRLQGPAIGNQGRDVQHVIVQPGVIAVDRQGAVVQTGVAARADAEDIGIRFALAAVAGNQVQNVVASAGADRVDPAVGGDDVVARACEELVGGVRPRQGVIAGCAKKRRHDVIPQKLRMNPREPGKRVCGDVTRCRRANADLHRRSDDPECVKCGAGCRFREPSQTQACARSGHLRCGGLILSGGRLVRLAAMVFPLHSLTSTKASTAPAVPPSCLQSRPTFHDAHPRLEVLTRGASLHP